MTDTLLSPHWYRVARLRPGLAAHARVERHTYRGTTWYVMEDTSSGRHYRFDHIAHHVIALMDGSRTVEEIWRVLGTALGDEAPTQEDLIRLLGLLHAANLLLCDVPPDAADLFRRHQRETRHRRHNRFLNPFAMRLPLFDPDAFLEKAAPWVRPFFTRAGLFAWVTVVGFGAILATKHWAGIAAHAADRAFLPGNLLMLWLLYPVMKVLHELGHALAAKIWGGAVHEMGVMFLVFTPVPYVDASAASAFRERRQRMAVSAAGIAVELFSATLALFVWIHVQPGAVRDLALNIMLISGVSTVLFNGNPLLRFDAYYMLVDAVGIPGLGPRAARYYSYLAQRYLFGLREAQSPVSASGEHGWFVGYGLASFAYRIGIATAIIIYLGAKYFVVGVVLALWACATLVARPLIKVARFILLSPMLQAQRAHAVFITTGLALSFVLALMTMPVPLSTHADGVLWLPEQAHVRAGADGFVVELLAPDGSRVRPGDPLLRIVDPDMELQLQALEAEKRELEARYFALYDQSLVKAEMVREELRAAEARLARMRERAADQIIRAGTAGTLVIPQAVDLPGRFVKQGEAIGYVVEWSAMTARIVVPQSDAGLFRRVIREVKLKSVDRHAEPVAIRVLREIPVAVERLPSRALGTRGGGSIEVDPLDESGVRTREKVFEIDLALPPDAGFMRIGTRVYARFEHGYEPLAFRWVRALRRQLLRQVAE